MQIFCDIYGKMQDFLRITRRFHAAQRTKDSRDWKSRVRNTGKILRTRVRTAVTEECFAVTGKRTIGFSGALDSPRWSRDGRVYGGRGVKRYGLRGMKFAGGAIKLNKNQQNPYECF